MYKVIKFFTDLQDNNYAYHVGDNFPRNGKVVSESRLAELSSAANKQGVPLIELIKEEKSDYVTPVIEEVKNDSESIMNEPVSDETNIVDPVPEKKRGRKSKQ